MRPSRYAPFSILSRYLVRQFLSLFLLIALGFVLLYLIVDLFDRMDIFLRHDASVQATARYFLFKIPLMLTQVTPPAVMTAVLLSLGLLARHNEITALRASGVSLTQTALPLLVTALGISFGILLWNETVVPYSSRQFEYINNIEIRKRDLKGILSDREIWYHGKSGFYNIGLVDKDRKILYGLVIYRMDDDFRLTSVVQVPSAAWAGDRWQTQGGIEHHMNGGVVSTTALQPDQLVIPETLNDFLEVAREPEELSFFTLRDWIVKLTRKGVDASEYLVDLHLKLSLPFASLILTLLGIPIGGRVRRHPSLALVAGLGLAVGFGYWVLLALSLSLGHSGALPPIVAAWSANLVFGLIGVALFLYSE